MNDPRVEKMAETLVNYCVNVKPGDWAVIQTSVLGEPLAQACASAVLKAGGHPTILLQPSRLHELLLREGSDEQLSFKPPLVELVIERADVLINITAPRNTRSLAGIDPARMALENKAMEAIQQTYMQRSGSGELRWTIAAYPTDAAAQDAGMSLGDYEDFVFEGGLLGEPDPVAAWQRLGQRQDEIVDWLKGKSEIHVVGPGTDLRVNVAGRTWLSDDGHLNFPGGEVFTGPKEDATEGVIQFNYPAVYGGREVTGISLRFEGGSVVEAKATGDDAYLQEMIGLDEGARRLGEFAIGTNPGIQRFSRSTLFDEKISGTIHMALGFSIPGPGGENESSLHWDMVYNLREGSTVTIDGELFSRNGEILI